MERNAINFALESIFQFVDLMEKPMVTNVFLNQQNVSANVVSIALSYHSCSAVLSAYLQIFKISYNADETSQPIITPLFHSYVMFNYS